MFVRPAPGHTLRDPVTRTFLPQEGEEVTANDYWLRAVRDGDVLVGPDPDPPIPHAEPLPVLAEVAEHHDGE